MSDLITQNEKTLPKPLDKLVCGEFKSGGCLGLEKDVAVSVLTGASDICRGVRSEVKVHRSSGQACAPPVRDIGNAMYQLHR